MDVVKPMGPVMRTFDFSGNTESKDLNLSVQPGIYSVNFYVDGKFVESQTIVIIE